MKPASELILLAFDIGSKRIGLALWSPKAKLSRPLPILERKGLKNDLAFIRNCIQSNQVEALVVGLPYALSGRSTESTENSIFWVEKLKAEFQLPVHTFDESLSTRDANALMRATKAKNKNEKRDSFAAALLLEDFIRYSLEKEKESR